MDNTGKAILIWGLICLVGFGIYHFALSDSNFPKPMIVWSVLVAIGVVAMILLVPNWMKNKTVWVWAVICVIGMIYQWLAIMRYVPLPIQGLAYWGFLMAIGFALTAYTWKNNMYYLAAAANLIVGLAIVFLSAFVGPYQLLLLAVVSGAPMIYDALSG